MTSQNDEVKNVPVHDPDQPLTAQQQIDDLRREMADLVRNHQHDGFNATRVNFNTDILGLFETVSAVPAGIPKAPYDQVKIYVNGATLRLYWYDAVAHAWHYVTATA